jgi:Tol biopolymer transport system component
MGNSFRSALVSAVLIISLSVAARSVEESRPRPSGDYMGSRPPGDSAEVFAPGVVSTGFDELNSVFSPDGKEFCFSIKRPNQDRHIMMIMRQVGGSWTAPRVLSFSSPFGDADPAFEKRGNGMLFVSKRPVTAEDDSDDWNIWQVGRTGDGWSEPRALDPPVNTGSHEIHPSLTDDETLYFSSDREGGMGRFDIYRSKRTDGRYGAPENIGAPVNTEHGEGDLFVAPDESYIVFSSGRPGGFGRNDLYISFMKTDGYWTVPLNMGGMVNSEEIEYCPFVTPDGKYLFYSSYRRERRGAEVPPRSYEDISRMYSTPGNGLGDIYWIDAAIIDTLRGEAFGP